jgi:hypothetical protein
VNENAERLRSKQILIATLTEADAAAAKSVSDRVRFRIVVNQAGWRSDKHVSYRFDEERKCSDGCHLCALATGGSWRRWGRPTRASSKALPDARDIGQSILTVVCRVFAR